MRKYILPVLVLGLLIGVSVLLYPTISKYVNSRSQTRTVARYYDAVANMDDTELQSILQEAHDYNTNLLSQTSRFRFTQAGTAEYMRQLNTGQGVMGVLVIDKIDVQLSIYHGTDETVLQVGIGHMQGTSLPVGGVGTHAVITGHRGVPSSRLLSNLDEMALGDLFVLYVLGETLTYQVDDIKTVLPHDARPLDIDRDMDYCTLVTCTPYGVNSHRLLVRGRRVENDAGPDWRALHTEAKFADRLITMGVAAVSVSPLLFIIVFFKCRKIRKGGYIRL
jgi:sortase A